MLDQDRIVKSRSASKAFLMMTHFGTGARFAGTAVLVALGVAFGACSTALGQLQLSAQPIPVAGGWLGTWLFHAGSDCMEVRRGRTAAIASEFGISFTSEVNYGNQFYGLFNDRLVYDLHHVYAFSGNPSFWLSQCTSQSYSSPGQAIGVLDDAVVFKSGSSGYLLRCGELQSSAFSNTIGDWQGVRSDEGLGVLQYGPTWHSSGIRLVSIEGNTVSLGEILLQPQAQWRFHELSVRQRQVTLRQLSADQSTSRVTSFTNRRGSWQLDRTVTDAEVGGLIVGIGDGRVIVRVGDTPSTITMRIVRIDGDSVYPESEVAISKYSGNDWSLCAAAYARRGSFIATFGNGTVYANRVEPCPGDVNADRAVDGADIGAMLSRWGGADTTWAADVDQDGVVDGADLGILLAFWGPCE